MNFPSELLKNQHFNRYYKTWQKNPLSIVFIPMAQICREQRMYKEAEDICAEGLNHHPDSVSGRLMLAWIYFDQDRFRESFKMVESILAEYPVQHEARSLLDKIRRKLAENKILKETNEESLLDEEATLSEEIAVSSTPEAIAENVSLWENVTMARIYLDQGETKTAKGILDRILARDPNHQKALELRRELK